MSLALSPPIQSLMTFLPLWIPLIFLASALVGRRMANRRGAGAWGLAGWASLVALLMSLVFASIAILAPLTTHALLQATPLAALMQLLASFIAFVVVRYSRTSMATEPGAGHYLVWLQLTLGAVTLAVVSNHLLVLLAAWIGVSLGLHQLLMFFPQRPRAALAAHKRFLLARFAELCLLVAFLLLHHVHNSWLIDDLLAAYPAELSVAEHTAAVLIAMAALVTCAQLPLHGWLIQVVEAPTPVSALLHGGIVNLGGFLLILFGPLLMLSTPGQWLILVIAGLTVVLTALIMTTRISIKVRLAWSTSAQMGLMLVECALGLFDLALLHLLAHSCYKAHAFLRAGDAVLVDERLRLAPVLPPSAGRMVSSLLLALAIIAGGVGLLTVFSHSPTGPWSPWWLLVLAVATLFLRGNGGGLWCWLPFIAVTLLAYISLKSLVGEVIPAASTGNLWADVWLIALFTLVFVGYHLQIHCAHLPWVKRLNIRLYGGFYLDEWATRATLTLWPVRLPMRMHAKQQRLIEGEI